MSVSLESVETTVPEEPIEELPEDPPEPQETVEEQPQIAEEPPPAPPEEPVVIKKRGRPPKAKAEAKPKAAPKARIKKPVTPVESSSSEEDTPINRDDMDTMLLQYLLQRKHAQRDSRRAMWVQMAGLS